MQILWSQLVCEKTLANFEESSLIKIKFLVDSVECYSCSSHTASSACYTGIFPLDTTEKITCSGITACQKINNLDG